MKEEKIQVLTNYLEKNKEMSDKILEDQTQSLMKLITQLKEALDCKTNELDFFKKRQDSITQMIEGLKEEIKTERDNFDSLTKFELPWQCETDNVVVIKQES